MSVTNTTKLLLAFRSGNRCAFPDCGKTLTVDGTQSNPVVTGEAAHIAGDKAGAARHDVTMTDEQRDHCSNLVYRSAHRAANRDAVDYGGIFRIR